MSVSAPILRRRANQAALYLSVCTLVLIMLIPIGWMLSTSFKPLRDVFQTPPQWIPDEITFKNYVAQFNEVLGTLMLNSMIVAVGAAVLATFVGAMTAYGISRFRFKGGALLMLFFMGSLAFPVPLLMISLYSLFVKLGLLNTYAALILGHTAVTIPVSIWLLKNFFDQLPREVEEAAYVDGASPLKVFLFVVLPMARPALAASAIFVFVVSWNELLFGLTFTSTTDMRPLPAGITLVFLQEFEGAWSEMMALAVMVSIPVLILFFFFQKTFLRGVTAGAVKG
ncbi:carbohydrate ABC transporter permease [Cognatishimia sp. SS12]|uniref:carbohydrate ABC transporter permease n=1 Tax=Cognatishimia sp. SS12 TaxID=2979465 RepID=UPI00232A7AAB|nr:carbohydrate ABC transporter permease [Cognatishimia sp. SS12]MDC0738303.1 carbohydrate ABC transporter permease [Cognatishimia sp. SS12]